MTDLERHIVSALGALRRARTISHPDEIVFEYMLNTGLERWAAQKAVGA